MNYLDAGEVDRMGRDSDQSSYKQSSEETTEEESDDGDEYAGTCVCLFVCLCFYMYMC